MEWSSWIEEVGLDLIRVPYQAAKAAYSVQASDWTVSRCRGKEGDITHHTTSLRVVVQMFRQSGAVGFNHGMGAKLRSSQ